MKIKIDLSVPPPKEANPYGTCPECGLPGTSTEKRPNGYSQCDNRHKFLREPYGICPECGLPGVSTERRLDGLSTCPSGHQFKRTRTPTGT